MIDKKREKILYTLRTKVDEGTPRERFAWSPYMIVNDKKTDLLVRALEHQAIDIVAHVDEITWDTVSDRYRSKSAAGAADKTTGTD